MSIFEIICCYTLLLAAFILLYYTVNKRYDVKYYEMLVSAIFRYRTQCYLENIEPGFDLDVISELPIWRFHWKYMIPEDYYEILKPFMDDLKDDDRFK